MSVSSSGNTARTLQIITAAMIGGVLTMAGMFILLNGGEMTDEAGMLTWMGIGVGGVTIINSAIIPGIIRGVRLKGIAAVSDEGERRALAEQTLLTVHLVGMALLEGGAVMNVVCYVVENCYYNLIMAGVAVVIMVVRFPTATSIDFQIDDIVRSPSLMN